MSNKSFFKKILSASVIVILLGLFSNVLGLIKEQWIAYNFGIGDEIDTFVMSLAIPLFIASLLSSAVTSVVIPAYIKSKVINQNFKLISELASLLLVFVLLITVVSILLSHFLLQYLAAGFQQEKLQNTIFFSTLLSPLIAIQTACSFYDGILNAEKKYILTSLLMSLIPAGTIVLLILFPGKNVFLLCAGLYLGFISKLMCQIIAYCYRLQGRLTLNLFTIKLSVTNNKKIIKEFFLLIFSSMILGLLPLISQSYAARLESGNVASLSYVNRLLGIGLALVSTAINAIILPAFSEVLVKDKKLAINLGYKLTAFCIFFGFIAVLIISPFVEPIVSLIFERGEFDSSSTSKVSSLLKYFLPYVPFYVAGVILARLVITLEMSKVFVVGNIISLIVFIVICEMLINSKGLFAIGIAYTVVYAISAAFLIFCVKRVKL